MSDDLRSIIGDSSNEEISSKEKFPEFNVEADMESHAFKLGMVFNSADDFKQTVRAYAIKNGKQIRFPTNEKHMVRAVCKDGCDWVMCASMVQGEHTMHVKTFVDKHTYNTVDTPYRKP